MRRAKKRIYAVPGFDKGRRSSDLGNTIATTPPNQYDSKAGPTVVGRFTGTPHISPISRPRAFGDTPFHLLTPRARWSHLVVFDYDAPSKRTRTTQGRQFAPSKSTAPRMHAAAYRFSYEQKSIYTRQAYDASYALIGQMSTGSINSMR